MARYVPIWDGVHYLLDTLDVVDRRVIGPLTEVEAEIFAFAGNAIAEGHSIAKTPGVFPKAHTMYGEVYDGPTDGVAPSRAEGTQP